jgi:hypothetical protein
MQNLCGFRILCSSCVTISETKVKDFYSYLRYVVDDWPKSTYNIPIAGQFKSGPLYEQPRR